MLQLSQPVVYLFDCFYPKYLLVHDGLLSALGLGLFPRLRCGSVIFGIFLWILFQFWVAVEAAFCTAAQFSALGPRNSGSRGFGMRTCPKPQTSALAMNLGAPPWLVIPGVSLSICLAWCWIPFLMVVMWTLYATYQLYINHMPLLGEDGRKLKLETAKRMVFLYQMGGAQNESFSSKWFLCCILMFLFWDV